MYSIQTGKGLVKEVFISSLVNFIPPELYITYGGRGNLHYLGVNVSKIVGSGIDFNLNGSVRRTVGEFIERYSGAILGAGGVKTSYTQLKEDGFDVLSPEDVWLYADWQYKNDGFKLKKWKKTDVITWMPAVHFFTKKEIYVPALLCNWVPSPWKKERPFTFTSTTGLAAGNNNNMAIRAGFLETLERDAFSKFWYLQRKIKLKMYDQNIVQENYTDDRRIDILFNNNNVDISVFDLTELSAVETIVSFILFDYKGKKMYSVGASSRFNKKEAIIKATLEAYQGIQFAINLLNRKFKNWPRNYKKVLSQLNNFDMLFNFYNAYPHLRKQVPIFRHLFSKKYSHFQICFDKLTSFNKEELLKFGYDDFVFIDLTTPDAKELGFSVAKVIVPRTIPLTGDFKYPYLGHKDFKKMEELFLELPHFFP